MLTSQNKKLKRFIWEQMSIMAWRKKYFLLEWIGSFHSLLLFLTSFCFIELTRPNGNASSSKMAF